MTRKKDKKQQTRRPVKMRFISARGDPQKQMQLFADADKQAILGEYQLAAGVWQHPRTGLWQVYMSTAGRDISWLSAYTDKTKADQAAQAYKQFCATGAVYDPEKCAAFFKLLTENQDAKPQPASAADIANITRHICEMAFDIHQ